MSTPANDAAGLVVPAPFTVHALATVDSTNDNAKTLAQAGAPHGTVVWAAEQVAGRGRFSRAWTSPPGNLYMSVVLRPQVAPPRTAELGFIAALAVAETVETFLPSGATVQLKWPNDVLVGGAKISGILLEGQFSGQGIAWVVAGIGVNIVSMPQSPAYPTTSLVASGAAGVTVAAVLGELLARLGAWLSAWREAGFEPVRAAWMRRAARLGDPVSVRIGPEPLTGRFGGIDHDGALLLETTAGTRRITAGEVAFGPA
jgi:BirA family biotin operon repressor/biotin-[acetyl-CoA-carboxylase] ligase